MGVVIRVGEARWPPVRGRLVGGKMRKLEGSPRIYFAEKRMPWGRLKLPQKEHSGDGIGDEAGRCLGAAFQGMLVRGEMRELEGSPRNYLAEKRMPWGRLKFR
jgi:hypothetical protein